MDCDGCGQCSVKNCSNCATILLGEAGCLWNGTVVNGNAWRRTLREERKGRNKARMDLNQQSRFENSFLSLTGISQRARIFTPAVKNAIVTSLRC